MVDLDMVVWNRTVDDRRFTATVERSIPYRGTLTVTVTETGETVLEEPVGLAYDALFGPDVDDVYEWESRTIAAIDQWLEANGG